MLNIQNIFSNIIRVFTRFQISILAAITGTILSCILVDRDLVKMITFIKIIMVCLLIFPLSLFLTIIAEQKKFRNLFKLGIGIFCILLGIGYYSFLPANLMPTHTYQLTLIILGIFTLGILLPFLRNKNFSEIEFWNYFYLLTLRFITTIFFVIVLYAGISLAIFAIQYLLNIQSNYLIFLRLWLVLVGIFSPFFFLAGIPEDLEILKNKIDYSKIYNIFTKFILIPLVIFYLLILYTYLAKIVFLWEWPKEGVSHFILAFCYTGTFTLLLIQPIISKAKAFYYYYQKFFYPIIIPLILVLFLAIGIRIQAYGITENRYIIFVLGIALLIIALYNIMKPKSIKIVFLTLGILAFLSAIGPVSAFSLSRYSQFSRLKTIFNKNNLLVNGKVQNNEQAFDNETAANIRSIVTYFVNNHGVANLAQFFDSEFNNHIVSLTNYKQITEINKKLGIANVTNSNNFRNYSWYESNKNKLQNIQGYEYLINYYYSLYDKNYLFETEKFNLNFVPGMNILNIFSQDSLLYSIEFTPIINNLIEKYPFYQNDVPAEEMIFKINGDLQISLINLNIQKNNDEIIVNSINANILLKK